jgi:hypothetical protein
MNGKTIGLVAFTIVLTIIVIIILAINSAGYFNDKTIINNNKITSLSYIDVTYNSAMEIVQDPSCVIVEKSTTNDVTAEKKGLYKIRDYYVLSSYNSCNTSTELQNNTISLQALRYVISQGVRFVDFEIYSLENQPVVSTSNSPENYYVFQSSNYVKFSDVFEIIINNAFNISTCPNPNDPLFVHLRIKSKNDTMFKNLATIFQTYESTTQHILGTDYSYEQMSCNPYEVSETDTTKTITANCSNNNVTEDPLYYYQNKIIIILDRSNTSALDCSELMEFVNLTSNSLYCRLMSNFTMIHISDQQELLTYNKRTITIVTPDIGINKNNPDINKSKELGIQFNANNFYKKDQYLTNSINMFNDAGCAFILKPASMRYYPIEVIIPKENDPNLSFGPREVKAPYMSFTI